MKHPRAGADIGFAIQNREVQDTLGVCQQLIDAPLGRLVSGEVTRYDLGIEELAVQVLIWPQMHQLLTLSCSRIETEKATSQSTEDEVVERDFGPLEAPGAGIAAIRALMDLFTASVLDLFVMLRAKAPPTAVKSAVRVATEHLEGLCAAPST